MSVAPLCKGGERFQLQFSVSAAVWHAQRSAVVPLLRMRHEGAKGVQRRGGGGGPAYIPSYTAVIQITHTLGKIPKLIFSTMGRVQKTP